MTLAEHATLNAERDAVFERAYALEARRTLIAHRAQVRRAVALFFERNGWLLEKLGMLSRSDNRNPNHPETRR
jgi:hypothetical protein